MNAGILLVHKRRLDQNQMNNSSVFKKYLLCGFGGYNIGALKV